MPRPVRFAAALALALALGASASAQDDRTLEVRRGQDRPADDAPAERTDARVALVLGNADYVGDLALRNPVHDAEDMAATLREIGFEVVTELDHGRADALAALDRFAALARGAEVALLFYAGHGAEVGGENYLIPVDFQPAAAVAPTEQALPLRDVLGAMAGAAIQVVVLDACRNAPFEGAAAGGGWAPPPTLDGGTFILYGTAPGAVADDNPTGRNGLFTSVLLDEIREPRQVTELMGRVIRRVREESRRLLAERGVARRPQSPWLSFSYGLPFYLVEPPEGAGGLDGSRAADVERWAAAGKAAYRREDYRAALPDLERAAEAGHIEAQYYLGRMYSTGRGVAEDRETAAGWYRLSAMRGFGKSQYALAGAYSGGFGVPRDDARALELYLRAAEQDFDVAQFRLGVVYEAGRGVRRDLYEAVRWYALAADQGHADAREALERLAADGNAAARQALRFL